MRADAADAQRAADIVNLRVWFARHLLNDAGEDPVMLQQAYETLGLALRDLRPERRGRPPGSGTYSRSELLMLVAASARDLHRGGRGPTLAAVAAALGWSRGGLGRALRRQSIDWRVVRSDAVRHAA